MIDVTFASSLVKWFTVAQRDLPWRKSYLPYHIWVSEIMAHQTQLDRVVPYFERFIQRWPSIEALAQANEDEALKLWEGLGYYKRCRNLLCATKVIVNRFAGELPRSEKELLTLPGIGKYTAGAILSIAYNLPATAIDANVLRVFSRVYNIHESVQSAAHHAFIEDRLRALMPKGKAREFNQALMEFGALICTPKTPSCTLCPIEPLCSAKAMGMEQQRPVSLKKTQIVRIAVATGILLYQGKIYVQKRRFSDVWPGLWEFPGGEIEQGESPEQAVVREYFEETGVNISVLASLPLVKHAYTKFRITLHGFYVGFLGDYQQPKILEAVEGHFAHFEKLENLAFPAGHRKLLEFMRSDKNFKDLLQKSMIINS